MMDQELENLINMAVTRALEQYQERVDTRHEQEHRFLRELMVTCVRINNVKWASIKAIIIGATLAFLAFVGFKVQP